MYTIINHLDWYKTLIMKLYEPFINLFFEGMDNNTMRWRPRSPPAAAKPLFPCYSSLSLPPRPAPPRHAVTLLRERAHCSPVWGVISGGCRSQVTDVVSHPIISSHRRGHRDNVAIWKKAVTYFWNFYPTFHFGNFAHMFLVFPKFENIFQ